MKPMREEPTLADTVYRGCFDKHTRQIFAPGFAQTLAMSRKFVLDDTMSAFMADLGWAAYQSKPARVLEIMDESRIFARVPFKTTWFEWNEKALARRASTAYASHMDVNLVPLKSGMLCFQHPQVDTAFMALSFGIQEDGGSSYLAACPFAFQWRSDEGPLLFKGEPMIDDILRHVKVADSVDKKIIGQGVDPAGMLTGCVDYRGPIGFCSASQYLRRFSFDLTRMTKLVGEQGGMMRYLLALLATINDLPVTISTVTAAKGFIGRGQYRKYLNHSTVTLSVPAERHVALARRTVSLLRRRAHEVRPHFRKDWRNPLSKICEHRFATVGEHVVCQECKGRKLWIKEHTRGNDRVGFTTHDYTVTHPTEQPDRPKLHSV